MNKQIGYMITREYGDYKRFVDLVMHNQKEGWQLVSVVQLEGEKDWREFHYVKYDNQ